MMRVIATARYGVAIGAVYAVSLIGLPTYAEEPGAKAQEPKTAPAKPAEPAKEKPSEQLKDQPKTPEKAPELKNSDAKTPASPSPAPKSAETRPAKAAEQAKETKEPPKSSEKAGDAKIPEIKAAPEPSGPKSIETKTPEPAKPPATPIISIKLALMADPRLFPYDINVDMNGDVAVLSGKVGSDTEKTAATEIAQGNEGVKAVTNNLEIAKDLPQTLARKKDDAITQYVKDRFGKSKTLESAHFDVKTEDGIVSLTGKTKFLVIALEAAEAARQVPGVKAVKSDGIRVEGTE